MRWRQIAIAAAALIAIVAGSFYVARRDDGRHTVGELSCASDSFHSMAIDFQGVPSWDTPEEALRETLAIHADVSAEVPSDGWRLDSVDGARAKWERLSDGHVVAVVEFPRVGGRWQFSTIESCSDP